MPGDGDRTAEPALLAVDDQVFVALSDRARRLAIYYLGSRCHVDVEELADVVTGWENAGRRGMATRADRDRVRASLREQHLPLMAGAGLVDYDESTGAVAVERISGPVRSLIDFAYESECDTNA